MSNVDLQSIDFEKSNIIFVDGLTLEKIKIKYNWILNASIKDAIIGEDDRGIVWYFGDWLCGEWYDGTWYSGNFYEGIWYDGLWYSYDLDKFDVLNQKFFIKQEGSQYSQFHNGIWKNGIFYDGTFGINTGETWTDYELFYGEYPNFRIETDNISGNIIYSNKDLATWLNGTFHTGLFYDAIWVNGNHLNGTMTNSKWLDGKWFNGTFDGDEWFNGFWYNGKFIKGTWQNGTFTKYDNNIISEFGNTKLDTDDYSAICIWYNGTWIKGDWYSGYNVDSNKKPIESDKNYLSIWYNGTWKNGTWYGGHFYNGTWENGIWKNGIFGRISTTDWSEPELVSTRPDTYNLGETWCGDTSISATSDADSVTSSNSANTQYEWVYYLQEVSISGVSIDSTNSSITFSQLEDYSVDYTDFTNDSTENGITGYDFEEIHENNDYVVNILYNNEDNQNYTIDSITATTSAYTWTATINGSDWISYEPILNNISSITYIIRRKVSLDSGNGSGDTYWSFTSQSSVYDSIIDNYYVAFEGSIEPNFDTGDFIYIEQSPNSINPDYDGITKVLSVTQSGDVWKVKTTQKFGKNSFDNGKIVNYLKLQKDRENVTGPSLFFQDFDFTFDFVENTATTLVTGYLVSYETDLDKDNNTNYGFYHGDVCLPWKNLYFTGFDIGQNNYTYDTTYDIGRYDPELYGGFDSLPTITGYKSVNNYIVNNLDGESRTHNIGGLVDLWGLTGLEEYYPYYNLNNDLTNLNPDDYNTRILKNINSKMRVSLNFLLKNNISQRLYLKNIKVKVYYSKNDAPKWLKGTWYKGTWYNGDFYNGLFKSGLWIKGNFYNGDMSSNYR
jgi:hypothetical protein